MQNLMSALVCSRSPGENRFLSLTPESKESVSEDEVVGPRPPNYREKLVRFSSMVLRCCVCWVVSRDGIES